MGMKTMKQLEKETTYDIICLISAIFYIGALITSIIIGLFGNSPFAGAIWLIISIVSVLIFAIFKTKLTKLRNGRKRR